MEDQRELFPDHEEAQRSGWAGIEKRMMTSLVCVVAEDSDGHTLKAMIASKRRDMDKDGNVTYVDYPVLVDLPVQFPSGGGTTFTFPIKKGDECVVHFMARPIDSWHQSGAADGPQMPSSTRMHSLSDGVAHVGIRSNPRKLNPPPSTVSSQMRSDDGKHLVDLHPTDGVKISVDGGKHTVVVNPESGISHTSTVAVAMKAPSLTHIGNLTLAPDPDTGEGGNLTISSLNGKGGNLTVAESITAKSVTSPEGSVGTA